MFFPQGSGVKNLPVNVGDTGDAVWSLGWEYSLEEEMATHSSILPWKIPWTEERGRLQFMESQRVGHNRAHTYWVLLPSESPYSRYSNLAELMAFKAFKLKSSYPMDLRFSPATVPLEWQRVTGSPHPQHSSLGAETSTSSLDATLLG